MLKSLLGLGWGLLLAPMTYATEIQVNVPDSRGPADVEAAVNHTLRQFGKNYAALTWNERRAQHLRLDSAPPVTLRLSGTQRSIPVPKVRGDITLQFETSGSRSFPTDYRDLLQATLDAAKPTINLIFGNAFESGVVKVRNYDADLGDRDAVAGGAYLHDNGSGEREIRFPIYQDGVGYKFEVTVVNFLHTLLLAYQGGMNFPGDGWNEGLVRASVARIARIPGSLPSGVDLNQVENILSSTYDIGGLYDWNNQPALACQRFIAPNLVDAALPAGGSVGGLYLLRYRMSGAAWQKLQVQYPTFANVFRRRIFGGYTTPTLATLLSTGQDSINELGGGGSLIEGRNFTGWARNQYILDTNTTPGLKLAVEPFPIVDGLSGTDFGVFGIQAHVFSTGTDGSETLSRETAFPIYLSPDYNRVFASSQDDRIDIFQGYGSVAPNFPGTAFGGNPYRITVDVPVQDRLSRINLPAGAIATPSRPTPNTVFGTLTGTSSQTAISYSVKLTLGSQSWTLPVTNDAFGGAPSGLPTFAALKVEVLKTDSTTTTTVLTRFVNKTANELALDLAIAPVTDQVFSIPAGVSVLASQIDPLRSGVFGALGLSESEALVARWNAYRGRFDLGSDVGSLTPGSAVFIRRDSSLNRTVSGFAPSGVPIAIPLRAGWNFITSPFAENIATNRIEVITESLVPTTYADAIGTTLGSDMFLFSPAAPDAVTGFPEGGSFQTTTVLPTGKGVYIRCFASSGATLLVRPTVSRLISRLSGPTNDGWRTRFTLLDTRGNSSIGEIGQSSRATSSFDRPFDSEAPPPFGSVPRLLVNQNMYREVGTLGTVGNWTINLAGLTPGQTYTLNCNGGPGSPVTDVLDLATGLRKRFQGSQIIQFRATSDTRSFRVTSRRSS